jgi:hypothetical protein
MDIAMEKETWKTAQYAFIVKNSIDWVNSTNPSRYMNNLAIRNLTQEEFGWLKELAQETGLVEYSGHAQPHGFVKGYRVFDFTEKIIAYYSLLKYKQLCLVQQKQIDNLVKDNKILQENIYDYKEQLLQAKDCEHETKEIVDNTTDILLGKIQAMEERLDQFLNRDKL